MAAHPQTTWKDVHAAVSRISEERGEWAGMPIPVEGTRMVIHPSYPFAKNFAQTFMPRESFRVCRNTDVREDIAHRNSWASFKDGRQINIWRDGKGFYFTYGHRQNSAPMIIETIGAARAWDYDAEIRAMQTLRRHITNWAFQCYVMTGSFLETSKRSGVIYMFRRLRPTVAMTSNPDRKGRDVGVRILCCLCRHVCGYYDGTWAGALVPTDDLIASLLLMRADEHALWKDSNHIPAWAPEAGL
jgi:hypothetical protein